MSNIINTLAKEIHQVNVENGWWEHRINIPKKMAESGLFSDEELEYVDSLMADQLTILQISELIEAMEARRNRKVNYDLVSFKDELASGGDFKSCFKKYIKDTYWDEKADTLIRLFDEIGHNDVDILELIELKNHYNSLRGKRHGGKVS